MLRFLKNRKGATAIEYAMIAGLIGLVIVGAIIPIGQWVATSFTDAKTGIDNAS